MNADTETPALNGPLAGEDWPSVGRLPGLDVSILHVYERHMERLPVPPVRCINIYIYPCLDLDLDLDLIAPPHLT